MIWLIDAGHGGMKDGVYTTPLTKGKQFDHGDFKIYEGVTNRKIAKLLMVEMQYADIPFLQIHDNVEDLSLTARVKKANKIKEPAIYLSIHSNAGKGKGFEIFTSPGNTASDPIAEEFYKDIAKDFPEYPFRADTSDGDHDKEERFTVLTETRMPAVLVELLFFDERKQAEFLLSHVGQSRLADCLLKTIKRLSI